MGGCRGFWFPVYLMASITLGVIGISSAVRSISKNSAKEEVDIIPSITHELSINASQALQKAGFRVMASLLRRSPLFFHPPQNSTIFAIKDSAIKNTSLSLSLLKNLLLYHTSTSKISFHDLLNKTPGTCIRTLYRQNNLALTKIDRSKKSVEINHVLISNPDMFLGNQLAIHGVLAPFSPFYLHRGWDFNPSPPPACPFNYSTFNQSKNYVEWNRLVRFLGSKGYASFSIALNSVLDGIKKESASLGLGYATIFAPPDFTLLGYPSTLLDRAVRLHIMPRRFTYQQLISLPVRTLLKTMVPDDDLEIDGVVSFMSGILINGVQVVVPDMFTSQKFVVHGISRAFNTPQLPA